MLGKCLPLKYNCSQYCDILMQMSFTQEGENMGEFLSSYSPAKDISSLWNDIRGISRIYSDRPFEIKAPTYL